MNLMNLYKKYSALKIGTFLYDLVHTLYPMHQKTWRKLEATLGPLNEEFKFWGGLLLNANGQIGLWFLTYSDQID